MSTNNCCQRQRVRLPILWARASKYWYMCILTCLIGVPQVVRLQVVVFREVLPCSVERPQAFVIVGYDSVRLVDAARAFRQLRVPLEEAPDPLRPRALLWLPGDLPPVAAELSNSFN